MKKLTLCLALGLSMCAPAFSEPVVTHDYGLEFTGRERSNEDLTQIYIPAYRFLSLKQIDREPDYVKICIEKTYGYVACYHAKATMSDFIEAVNDLPHGFSRTFVRR